MTEKIIHENRLDVEPNIAIGPPVAADIRRRIRELEARLPSAMTATNRTELSKLKKMLELLATTGGSDA